MASGYELQGNDIRTRWLIQQVSWPSESSTAVVFDNYDEDDSGVPEAKQNRSPWIAVSIIDGPEQQVCMGYTNRWRNTGTLINDIFLPMGMGPARADKIADYIANDWRGASIRYIQFKAPSRIRQGSPDGKWYIMTVEIPFYRDDFYASTNYSHSVGEVAIEQEVTVPDSSIFSVYDWISIEPGLVSGAIADNTQQLRLVRPITEIVNATTIKIATGGSLTISAHGWPQGYEIFVSQTLAGQVEAKTPGSQYSSGWNKVVANVIDENTIDLVDLQPWLS